MACVGQVGAGAAQWATWADRMPADVALAGVCLPGREKRSAEPPHRDMHAAINELQESVATLGDRMLVLFGHCGGALIAHELTRRLCGAGGRVPAHFFVASQVAPILATPTVPALDTPDEVRNHLRAIGETDERLLARDEFIRIVTPRLRADYEVLESHPYMPHRPLPVPTTVFVGQDDRSISPEDAKGWRRETSAGFELLRVPGGHLLRESWLELPGMVVDRLRAAGVLSGVW